jgi:hypothetical protein
MTGYVILQIARYVDASGDEDILDDVIPMIAWCLAAQVQHLVLGALPFNGDETYVAGGMLPRWALNDGSVEATILLYESIRQLSRYAHHPAVARLCASYQATADLIAREFSENFIRDGVVVTNSLRRRHAIDPPPARSGVCENCSFSPTTVVRGPAGRYLCLRCDGVALPAPPERELSIASAALFAALVPTDLVTEPLTTRALDRALAESSSGAASAGCAAPREMTVGYDDGLLLRGLTRRHSADAHQVANSILGKRDYYGTWAEYYESGRPVRTRCRPWETSLNLGALAEYAAWLASGQ